jgi:hypothetical protein
VVRGRGLRFKDSPESGNLIIFPRPALSSLSTSILEDMSSAFRRALESTQVLCAIGYAFKDDDIRGIVEAWLRSSEDRQLALAGRQVAAVSARFSSECSRQIVTIEENIESSSSLAASLQASLTIRS